MHFSAIKYCDIANGLGVRTSLFVSGCTLHCKDCFNQEAQDFTAGNPFDEEVEKTILSSLEPSYIAGLSVLGGEPMEPKNQSALAPFLQKVKTTFPRKPTWLYSGYLFEDLLANTGPKHTSDTLSLLKAVDVLVDGPFVASLKDISLRFRGSSNQRIIDVPKSLSQGRVVLFDFE